jgi:hypothetical protein
MKASLIYCKQFQAVRSAKVGVEVPLPQVVVSPDSASLAIPAEAAVESKEEKPEPKKRGRKPNPKKELKPFVIEEKEVILDFS